MAKRAWTLVLALGLCLSTQACGDDDDSEDGDSSNDSGSGGSGARSGSGGSGRAGSGSGRAGSGSGTSGSGSVDEDIARCMAQQGGGGGGGAMPNCEGIDEYSECVQDMCSAQDCMDEGCADYFGCVEDAADPCRPTGCTPSSACTMCLTDTSTCALDNCLDLLQCGETAAGGACDQLDDCCAEQQDSMRMICEQAAQGARTAGGDMLCMTVMGAFCM